MARNVRRKAPPWSSRPAKRSWRSAPPFEDIAGRIEQIAIAAELTLASAQTMQDSISELAAVAEQSSASTQQVSASTEETSASAEQIAASAHELSSNAESLNRLVAQFKLKS